MEDLNYELVEGSVHKVRFNKELAVIDPFYFNTGGYDPSGVFELDHEEEVVIRIRSSEDEEIEPKLNDSAKEALHNSFPNLTEAQLNKIIETAKWVKVVERCNGMKYSCPGFWSFMFYGVHPGTEWVEEDSLFAVWNKT